LSISHAVELKELRRLVDQLAAQFGAITERVQTLEQAAPKQPLKLPPREGRAAHGAG
jgi:hypothetical protein